MTQPPTCRITIDGVEREVPVTATVAVVLMNAGLGFRRSTTGELRGVLCAMGVCHECRVRIDGQSHQRACMRLVRPGMQVERDD
jgi:predicted molibdopterin-dependent oxidoreductase YjgC